jgi:hypothetical protein
MKKNKLFLLKFQNPYTIMEIMKNLALKAEIVRRFGTQGKFAKAIGWEENKLSLVINGWVPPEKDRVLFAKTLKIKVEEIFQG